MGPVSLIQYTSRFSTVIRLAKHMIVQYQLLQNGTNSLSHYAMPLGKEPLDDEFGRFFLVEPS